MPCLPFSYDDDGQAATALPLSAADYQPPFLWMDFAARLRLRSIHPTRGIGCLSPLFEQGSSPCFGSSLLRPRAPVFGRRNSPGGLFPENSRANAKGHARGLMIPVPAATESGRFFPQNARCHGHRFTRSPQNSAPVIWLAWSYPENAWTAWTTVQGKENPPPRNCACAAAAR